MKIAIGADHRGFQYKEAILSAFPDIEWVDVGCNGTERCDFPTFAYKVVDKILQKEVKRGIVVCGSGIGMSIASNRFKGIYAALVWNTELAKLCRQHNNSNVLALPANFISVDQALEIIRVWSEAEFLGGHYQERVAMLDNI